MANNPPLTYIINVFNIFTYLNNGNTQMILPMNFAAIIPGFIMTYVYPKRISEKYTKGNINQMQFLDIIGHWVPAILSMKLNSNRRIKINNVLSVYLLPWIYFSMKHKKNGTFGFTNPFKHVQETYPGVPMWVFSTWYVGSILPYLCSRKEKNIYDKLTRIKWLN